MATDNALNQQPDSEVPNNDVPASDKIRRVELHDKGVLTINPHSDVAPYEQLRAGITKLIKENRLPVGLKLPTVRALAAELSLAPNTVAKSYRELEDAGFITAKGRLGTFVAAQGNKSKERALAAARRYAQEAHQLGLDSTEATAIVTAAIAATSHSSPS